MQVHKPRIIGAARDGIQSEMDMSIAAYGLALCAYLDDPWGGRNPGAMHRLINTLGLVIGEQTRVEHPNRVHLFTEGMEALTLLARRNHEYGAEKLFRTIEQALALKTARLRQKRFHTAFAGSLSVIGRSLLEENNLSMVMKISAWYPPREGFKFLNELRRWAKDTGKEEHSGQIGQYLKSRLEERLLLKVASSAKNDKDTNADTNASGTRTLSSNRKFRV